MFQLVYVMYVTNKMILVIRVGSSSLCMLQAEAEVNGKV
jgi:hypothetical protein